MPTPIEAAQYPALITLINGTYSDKVESILSAQIQDDDSILAIGQDGKKQIAVQITEDNIKIRLINPEVIKADFAEGDEADTVDGYREQMRGAGGPITDDWVGQVKGMLDGAGDLASFSENLLTLYPNLEGDKLRQIMTDAMTAASIAGSQEDA
jgi:phage gp29-like protein